MPLRDLWALPEAGVALVVAEARVPAEAPVPAEARFPLTLCRERAVAGAVGAAVVAGAAGCAVCPC